jgi:RNA polymerase primary sigma factor
MTLHTHLNRQDIVADRTAAETSAPDSQTLQALEGADGETKRVDDLVQPDDSRAAIPDRCGEIGLYLQDIARAPQLTAEDEVRLGRRIRRGRLAQRKLARDGLDPQVRSKLESVIGIGCQARNRLVEANTRLVVFVARKYVGRGVPLPDLIQEGNLGLMEAARQFDVTRGYRFSTYAAWWVRHYIVRAIANQGRTIRLPVHIRAELYRLFRASHQFVQAQGREPAPMDLAQAMERPLEQVRWLLQIAFEPLSLEQPAGETDDNLLGDFIEDADAPSPSESAALRRQSDQMNEILACLPGNEGLVLRLRYGFEDGVRHTLKETGVMLGFTRQRAEQIEKRALRRLRKSGAVRLLFEKQTYATGTSGAIRPSRQQDHPAGGTWQSAS